MVKGLEGMQGQEKFVHLFTLRGKLLSYAFMEYNEKDLLENKLKTHVTQRTIAETKLLSKTNKNKNPRIEHTIRGFDLY